LKIIGLTGGIGSGKTTVAKMFRQLGAPIYIADEEAKKIMDTARVKEQIINLFGEQAYSNNQLNSKFIAQIVFKDKTMLQHLNAIVHPEVRKHFQQWLKKQKAPYIIKENAILFETDAAKNCDFTIVVTTEKDVKLSRIQQRDNSSIEEIEARMNNQWPDEKKVSLADYVIDNSKGLSETQQQVLSLHQRFLS
jgi:dephospho-CoA kinase